MGQTIFARAFLVSWCLGGERFALPAPSLPPPLSQGLASRERPTDSKALSAACLLTPEN
jgi:hypothetical protein